MCVRVLHIHLGCVEAYVWQSCATRANRSIFKIFARGIELDIGI